MLSAVFTIRPCELALWAVLMSAVCAWAASPHIVRREPPPDPPTFRLDLNTASVAELRMLPGVGPRRAQLILQARQKQGGFSSVSQLAGVRGLGLGLTRRIEPMVRVAGPATGR